MSTIRLYTGNGMSRSETEVARLVDGTVQVGHGPSQTYPAHVDRDGTVMFGATWTYGPAQTVLGHVNEKDRTVTEGMSRYGDTIGSWDEDGTVYGGPSYRREQVGRCDPPSGAGAACLLLLFADGAPHKKALIAAAQPDSNFKGMEVKLPKEKKPRDPGHEAAVAVGIATGAATLAAEGALARWWRTRKTAQTAPGNTPGTPAARNPAPAPAPGPASIPKPPSTAGPSGPAQPPVVNMSNSAPEQRVCPECGAPAGEQPFCSSCGRNLSTVDRLPTRGEWEASLPSATTTAAPAESASSTPPPAAAAAAAAEPAAKTGAASSPAAAGAPPLSGANGPTASSGQPGRKRALIVASVLIVAAVIAAVVVATSGGSTKNPGPTVGAQVESAFLGAINEGIGSSPVEGFFWQAQLGSQCNDQDSGIALPNVTAEDLSEDAPMLFHCSVDVLGNNGGSENTGGQFGALYYLTLNANGHWKATWEPLAITAYDVVDPCDGAGCNVINVNADDVQGTLAGGQPVQSSSGSSGTSNNSSASSTPAVVTTPATTPAVTSSPAPAPASSIPPDSVSDMGTSPCGYLPATSTARGVNYLAGTGVSCATVKHIAQAVIASDPCYDNSSCTIDGYNCTNTTDHGGLDLQQTCVDGDRKVVFNTAGSPA